MEPTFLVIGLNHRTAPLAMREQFWIGENRRYDVLRQLQSADGIEEVVILSTCARTEFLFWATEAAQASNSLLHFLTTEHGLKLSDWEHFYRLLDEAALTHLFQVASGLDSFVLGDPHIVSQVKAAWEQAGRVGTAGRFLNAVLEKALSVSQRIRNETEIGKLADSVPTAALDLSEQVFGSLTGRRVLLLGAGKMGEVSARRVTEAGGAVVVIDQSPARAQELAEKTGGTAANIADRWLCMLHADVVISATGCPHVVLSREEAERIATERKRVPLLIIDIAMPRDVDPEVRRVDGILLYDLDGLQRAVKNTDSEGSDAVVASAEKIVTAEAQTFRSQLQTDSVVPTIVALRHRLDELCRQELDSFIEQRGPFSREQDQSLHALTNHVIRKIASCLARELRGIPEKQEKEQMAAAVARLFHLESLQTSLPGTGLENHHSENVAQTPSQAPSPVRAIASNF